MALCTVVITGATPTANPHRCTPARMLVSLASAFGRRRPVVRALGAGMLLGAALFQRWAGYRAGLISACDPKYTVGPQRARADARTIT